MAAHAFKSFSDPVLLLQKANQAGGAKVQAAALERIRVLQCNEEYLRPGTCIGASGSSKVSWAIGAPDDLGCVVLEAQLKEVSHVCHEANPGLQAVEGVESGVPGSEFCRQRHCHPEHNVNGRPRLALLLAPLFPSQGGNRRHLQKMTAAASGSDDPTLESTAN